MIRVGCEHLCATQLRNDVSEFKEDIDYDLSDIPMLPAADGLCSTGRFRALLHSSSEELTFTKAGEQTL